MAKVTKKSENVEIIQPIKMRTIIVKIVGTSPMIMHRFSQKAWQELLFPSGRKNASERASSLKHNPIEEYRGALYRNRDPKAHALFHLPNGTIHGAMASAALDIPGATRSGMERLTSVINNVDIFGIPQLLMSMVRSSDMNRTPDVRTRPIFPRWACEAVIEFKLDPLTDSQILNLLGAAGQIVGVGDWRPQKGGSYGKFRICSDNDAEYREITTKQGRVPQLQAFERPEEYDEDSAELMSWFTSEVARRRQDDDEGAAIPKGRARKGNGVELEARV